jgi:hypothetical protein
LNSLEGESLSDEPDNTICSASDVEFDSDNEDSIITMSDGRLLKAELQQMSNQKPDESGLSLDQLSSCRGWHRMDDEPLDVQESTVDKNAVKRVTEESSGVARILHLGGGARKTQR